MMFIAFCIPFSVYCILQSFAVWNRFCCHSAPQFLHGADFAAIVLLLLPCEPDFTAFSRNSFLWSSMQFAVSCCMEQIMLPFSCHMKQILLLFWSSFYYIKPKLLLNALYSATWNRCSRYSAPPPAIRLVFCLLIIFICFIFLLFRTIIIFVITAYWFTICLERVDHGISRAQWCNAASTLIAYW